MVIVIENGLSEESSNPGWGCLYFTFSNTRGGGEYEIICSFALLTELFSLAVAIDRIEFKSSVPYLKIDLVLHPVCSGEVR